MTTVEYEGFPAQYDVRIVRGDTWQFDLEYEDPEGTAIDLSGYSARLQIRETKLADTTLLSLSSDDGDITLNSDGEIAVTATATATAALDFDRARYDLEITSAGGVVTTLVEGVAILIKDVTR